MRSVKNLYDTIKQAKLDAQSKQERSFEELSIDQKNLELEFKIEYGDQGFEPSQKR